MPIFPAFRPFFFRKKVQKFFFNFAENFTFLQNLKKMWLLTENGNVGNDEALLVEWQNSDFDKIIKKNEKFSMF